MYGLKQAPRAWFEKLKGTLLTWSFHNSVSDTSLFYTHRNGRMLLLLVYVDDILITGESFDDVQMVIRVLNKKFAFQDLGSVSDFLGFEVTRNSSQFHLCQSKYAGDLLQRTNIWLMLGLVLLL